jgi:hypothetical protein
LPTLTRKVFEKFGFSASTLITEWSEIAGPEIAAWTMPERLRWPRHTDSDVPESPTRRTAATLVLRVEPARALNVQYRRHQLIERINSYFGYRAVGDLRIVQAPLPATEAPPPRVTLRRARGASALTGLDQITDESLRAALVRLHTSVSGA